MKQLHGEARSSVDANREDALALLADIEGYPRWYPDVVTDVSVAETDADGGVRTVLGRLHLAYGPVSKDLELLLALEVREPDLVKLTHVPHGESRDGASFDATWRIEDDGGTQLHLELDATMGLPRLLPVAGIGDTFAEGFMRAAVAALSARA